MVLLTYIYILVMSGPAKNSLRNANILVNSLNCGKEMVSKQAKAILKTILAPLVAILDIMRDILQALKDFAKMLKEAFIAIRDLFLEISRGLYLCSILTLPSYSLPRSIWTPGIYKNE